MNNRPLRVLLIDEEPFSRMMSAGLILRDPRTLLAEDTGEPEETLISADEQPIDLTDFYRAPKRGLMVFLEVGFQTIS